MGFAMRMGGMVLKILYGTTNPAKLAAMRKVTDPLGIELIGLHELDLPIPAAAETGTDILQNAELKARAYFEAFGMPVFSCDSGLYFDGFPPELQPGPFVRRVNGRDLTDDEMTAYYASLAHSRGGTLKARYRNAICLILSPDRMIKSEDISLASEPFLLTDTPHPKRVKGFPLDALSKEPGTGAYYYDLPETPGDNSSIDAGFTAFFRKALNLI